MSKVTILSKPNRIVIASKGVQGKPGPASTVAGPEGPSAYQVAVEEGFTGTEGEWLASLKGPTGDVTPEAIAARDTAVGAASAASQSADAAAVSENMASAKASEAAASADLAEQARLLGATIGFATKADMDASLAYPDGTLALVTNDPDPANSVTYRKTGASGSGSWVQSADRVTGLEGRVIAAETEIDDQAETLSRVGAFKDGLGEDVEQLLDARSSIVRRVDSDGEMHVPGLPEGYTSQGAARAALHSGSQGGGVDRRDVMVWEDAGGNCVGRMDWRGAFYLPGMRQPVQAAAGQTLSPTTFPRTDREKLHPSIAPLIDSLIREGQPFIPPPTMLVPNGYGVPNGFISAFSVDEDAGIVLETPYANGGLVHPYLLEMRRPLLGYRFLMMESPHKFGNAREENPLMYGSNDLRRFDLIPDIDQPMGFPPADQARYMQDPGFTYDPRTGELIVFWTALSDFRSRSTFDGVNWSQEEVTTTGGGAGVSPAILYDPVGGTWHLWGAWNNVLHHQTGPTYRGPWTEVGQENFRTTHGIDIWHLEVKWMGERFMLLANQREPGSGLWLGYSSDGTSWTMGPQLVPSPANIYKGTFLPEFDGDRVRIHLGWNTYAFPLPPGVSDNFHLVASDWVDLDSL